MHGSRARYRFGPLERRGLIAGWRGGQIGVVAAGAVLAIVVMRHQPTPLTVVAAVIVVAACVAVAWWPIAGRTAEQWLPTVVRWGVTAPLGGRRRRPGVESAGHCIGADGAPCLVAPAVARVPGRPHIPAKDAPPSAAARAGPYGGLRVLGFDAHQTDAPMGVVCDARTKTYTAVMAVLGQSFALLGGAEKERRVASWAAVLTSLSRERSVVHRVQWVATTIPDDGAAVSGHLASHAVLPADAPARRSYATLLDVAGPDTSRHEVHVAVQVRAAGPAARAMRSLGGGDAAGCAVLSREVASLRRQLVDADIPVERVLDERSLAAVVRRSVDAPPAGGRRCPPCGVSWPWPLVTEVEWGALHADGSWHATYWIAEWPRVDVGPEFLGPLLLGPVRRAVAVVMEPLSSTQAVRHAERARTADIADAELRRRGGFLSTARRAREAELATHREEELADGHASFRFSGYVTVGAATREQLSVACDATEQAASQCRLELRRLYGDQERAFTCTLPIARGLG